MEEYGSAEELVLGCAFYLPLLAAIIYAIRRRRQWSDPAGRVDYMAGIVLWVLLACIDLIVGTVMIQNTPRGGW